MIPKTIFIRFRRYRPARSHVPAPSRNRRLEETDTARMRTETRSCTLVENLAHSHLLFHADRTVLRQSVAPDVLT